MIILNNYSLLAFNTMGIDVKARTFASFSDADGLIQLLEGGAANNQPLVLGGGSNILLRKIMTGGY
ncbi:hypothetical protein [Paraflavitalea speifideaquila]|uniref:hypothetical protein n=1 Tax=Paraflavitalea speifideaquila TaxID=3076558 RepID=UPI0028E2F6C8|nr:hypothetical protein [Paraflavitalea speifideiaquila]